MSIVASAAQFAAFDFHVFPLLQRLVNEKNTKGAPLGWNHNRPNDPKSIPSTNDPSVVQDWDYEDLIGFGVNPRDKRAVILDVDVKHGKTGGESLRALINDFNLSVDTFVVKTPSGGAHLYFEYPNIPEDQYILGTLIEGYPDIDLRTDNNFVVGPHDGGQYKIARGNLGNLAPLPIALVGKLPVKTKGQLTTTTADLVVSEDKMAGVIPDHIPKGERDNTLIRLIGSWCRRFPREMVLQLLDIALDRCEGALEREVYVERVDATLAKESFRPTAGEAQRQWMEENLILIPEKTAVAQMSETVHRIIRLQAARDKFANWVYYEETPTGRQRKVVTFERWMESAKRQTLKGFAYYPGQPDVTWCDIQRAEVVNTYYAPFVGYQSPGKDYRHYVRRYLELTQILWEDHAELALDWVAHVVQHPDKKLAFAPVLISEERGIGKNLWYDVIKNMVGPWNCTETDPFRAIDKHNEFALHHHLVLINEANIDPRNKRALSMHQDLMERLKSKITEYMDTVEPKFMGRFNIRTFVNYIVFSNSLDGIPIETHDRRFFVHESSAKRQDRDWYEDLWKMARTSTQEPEAPHIAYALREYFLNREIKLVQQGMTAPMTEAKQKVIDAGKTAEADYIEEMLVHRASIFRGDIITKELFDWFVDFKLPRGRKLSSGAVKNLFKTYTQPIDYNGRAKRMQVMSPPRYIDGAPLPGQIEKASLYTVRRHGEYNDADSAIIRRQYDMALEATKYDYQEGPDVQSKSE